MSYSAQRLPNCIRKMKTPYQKALSEVSFNSNSEQELSRGGF